MRAPLTVALLAYVLSLSSGKTETPNNEAHIGVLAYRGSDDLRLTWTPLSDYLAAVVPDWSFTIVPMTLSSANEQIKSGQLDFVVTNPGHFVILDDVHRMSVLASRSQRKSDGRLSAEFGSALITQNDSGIQSLQDVEGKSVVAVGADAFGGFQVAWYEFDRAGIDLFSDTSSLTFVGFPMDQVVTMVLSGEADVGIVRSGLMEELVSEGRVRLDEFDFLNSNIVYNHPDTVSTNLYPEWPFAALATADPDLKNQITIGLVQSGTNPLAKATGMKDVWTAPLPYHGVRELMDAYKATLKLSNSPSSASVSNGVWVLTALFFAGFALWWRHIKTIARSPIADGEDNLSEKAGLTQREREVLTLIAKGHSTKEIALDLGISPKTVEFHRSNLLRKFGARTSSQLVAMAT